MEEWLIEYSHESTFVLSISNRIKNLSLSSSPDPIGARPKQSLACGFCSVNRHRIFRCVVSFIFVYYFRTFLTDNCGFSGSWALKKSESCGVFVCCFVTLMFLALKTINFNRKGRNDFYAERHKVSRSFMFSLSVFLRF